MTSMTVPVRLTKNDIAVLADELNNCDSGSSELADILEKILKSAHETGVTARTLSQNQRQTKAK